MKFQDAETGSGPPSYEAVSYTHLVAGGLSAGIGSMMYDFTIPQFIAGSPFTFAFKFLMAYTAGCVVGKSKDKIAPARIITAGVLGQLLSLIHIFGSI